MNPDDTIIIPPAQQVLYLPDDDDEIDSDLDTTPEPTPLIADGQPD